MEVKEIREKLKLSQQELSDKTGIPKDRIAKWEQGKGAPKSNDSKILDKLIEEFVPHETNELQEPAPSYLKTRQGIKNGKTKDIPVFIGNTRAGTIEVYSDDPAMQHPVSHLPSEIFPGCNHAEKVSGDSMHPLVINQGFVIGKIIDKKGIIYGEKYVVHTKYGLSMVKYLQEASKKNYVKLVSYNKHIEPQEVPFDDITFCCRIYFIVNPS